MELTLSAGVVTAAVLEGFKAIWRTWVAKNPTYDFPPKFYIIAVPLTNFVLTPALAVLGFSGFVLPTDWSAWGMDLARLVVYTLVSSAVSLVAYSGYKPLKAYGRTFLSGKAKK